MDVSCAFPPGVRTPGLVELAEDLGYRRAWLYDSPGLYADVWAVMALCAERTERIGLGPAVVVPGARHVMTTAAAVATVDALAPGRLAVAVGSGFTGRFVLGRRPHRWTDVAAYVRALRALLRGDETRWEGATVRMMHPGGLVANRPVDVPILVGAQGPKGLEVARELGDGVLSASATMPHEGFEWSVTLGSGTVLEEGERADSERVIEAVGPTVTPSFHFLYEHGSVGAFTLDAMPGGPEWRAEVDAVPAERRHLALHEGHMVEIADRDRSIVSGDLVAGLTLTGTADDVRGRIEALGAGGATELAYQPAGPDPERELRAFAEAAGL